MWPEITFAAAPMAMIGALAVMLQTAQVLARLALLLRHRRFSRET